MPIQRNPMKTLAVIISLLVTVLGASAGKAEEMENSDESMGNGFIYMKRSKRATDSQEKCSYTFIVPQQKVSGAICVNTKDPIFENRANKQELDLLGSELLKQKRQIETLQQLVEVDGGIVNEVKLLRKESRNMNSRVSQLYMQLLHEIIRKRDNALEYSQLENKILNQTAEMLQLTNKYKDLEHKYQHLVSLANNQSTLIIKLEEQCQKMLPIRPIPQPPPEQPKTAYQPPVYNRITNQISTNEIQFQGDDILKISQPTLPTIPSVNSSLTATNKPPGSWRDCLQAMESGMENSGVYYVKPENTNQLVQVWCDQTHDPGGWTVIQRRQDGSINFFRNWEAYKQGFGNIDGEHWLGLENIYLLTNQDNYQLLITMEDWEGRKFYAQYASFRLEPESDYYRLRVGRYNGNAGDSFTSHSGKRFTTLDRDHDSYPGNCAHSQKGGWWYNACAHSNLNGVWYHGNRYRNKYSDGIYWNGLNSNFYSLKKVVMMIKPNPNTFH
ncbi:angiopoietin-related protein 2b [Latimeria chalumnae]|uniref:Angiopoietin like 2 n=1 Tax=Latimeria chalumnae TaxID=7897 RepID=H3B350_LATCH|nr:PREDICTED: angiopoietin-related protein 2 [Latimeria chalumnae]XP_005987364.1 PREDICTED: angiopoietin-related protein 2 [Latimeria chalumnae]XP_005987365.1 PREDICTED: angiopoietin-related protein 2 [Latimeria chalumnae]|eukprot:XP_005987363.1 PREDICTED: angiopoietin-related protein 2 [Latimeria chalumnae]